MKILSRYLAREFTQNFFLGLGAFSATYLVVDFFERMHAFLSNKASWLMIGAYFLNKFPLMLFQVAPAAVLLASILTIGIMSRHNELMALKSGGVGLWSLTHPIMGVVGLIFVGLLGMNEFIVPYANQNARKINMVIHKRKPMEAFKQSQIWIRGQQAIYNVQLYHPERDLLEGITFYRFSPQFELLERVDARSAQWTDGKWVLTDASVTDFTEKGVAVRKKYAHLTLSLKETPLDFRVAEKNPNEMNYRELKEYVRNIERDGYNASKYRTAMYACISFPFITVIMAFLGIPLAMRKERGAGLALGIGYCILISFIYLVVYSFILELGKAGNLPSIAAAWLGNIIFGMVGMYLLLSVRH